MLKRAFCLFILCVHFATPALFSLDAIVEPLPQEVLKSSGIVRREQVPELNLVVLTLKNGMKVGLKKTSSDEEIIVRLMGLGGYSSLPESQKASGYLAAQAAIRSGFGPYHFDQLHALLFDKSIEFGSEILPLSRYVGGTARWDEIGSLMNLIHLFFTEHQLTEHSFRKVMEKAQQQVFYRNKPSSKSFVEDYKEFMHPQLSALKALTAKDLDRADYKIAASFFDSCFSDPAEFAGVIAGAFDMEKMIALVDRHLATIPNPNNKQQKCSLPDIAPIPEGIKSKLVKINTNLGDAMTILTLPVQVPVTQEDIIPLENISQLIGFRLKKVLREHYGNDSVIINVTSEYPLYPSMAHSFIKIEYFSEPKFVSPMGQTIMAELNNLQTTGVTSEEINIMHGKYRKSQRLREDDNCYWMTVLSNYLLWNWNINGLSRDFVPLEAGEKIQTVLQTYFSLKNYSMITGQPQKN